MRPKINSPLTPCQLPNSGQLSPYQAIGLVTDLAINHSYYNELTVQGILARLMPALESGQAKVFFDDDCRPYGYASWASLPNEEHQSLLTGGDSKLADATYFFQTQSYGHNLWFFDLLCPFTSPLAMLRMLKREISDHNTAQLLPHETSIVRRLW